MSSKEIKIPSEMTADHLVLGSGPGGSVAACLLAEGGRDVLVLEEGPHLPLTSAPPFSREEMVQKYRNGGLTVAMGRAKVSYVEGRCVGGGSEVNSGLYHRTPPAVLDEWSRAFGIEECLESHLRPHFEANERDLSISYLNGRAPVASERLHEGAVRLGWSSIEVPRWFAYSRPDEQTGYGTKQSMTETMIPRALAAGARLMPGTRALRLTRRKDRWSVQAEHVSPAGERSRLTLESPHVFIACGAVHTPALLRRSGLGRHAGDSFHLHPTAKVVARFDDEVNPTGPWAPVHQVKQFAPRISFGCSISMQPQLALGMIDHPAHFRDVLRDPRRSAIYYAMTTGGKGTVRPVPGYRDPLVRFRLTDADLGDLAEGLRLLCRCLFEAGARALYPGTGRRDHSLSGEGDIETIPDILAAQSANLMSIHLFSSCPMGEDRRRCTVDSFGRVHGEPGLWVSDASLLPGPPGVNPQGSLMAIVRRNVMRFLGAA